ncbi:MAG: DUF971 domain-containing protein [Myxococcota bacterium]
MRSRFQDIEPKDLAWTEAGAARIVWSDGHTSVYTPALLRSICPCADCKGTHGGPPKAFNVLSAKQVEGAHRQIVIDGVEPMGHYAVAFRWGDGHREGIYSWTYLRGECPCATCVSYRAEGEESLR